jgi:predicted nucleotidyltransferase/ribosomal protein S18 acetylase RimI-like enzyme
MINIDPRHLKIIKNILSKYDYTFYLFGSRLTYKAKAFSDIDLYYTEDIPATLLNKLEEDFEESDLPYKADLVDYNKCDEGFKKIMLQNYLCLQASSKLQIIEDTVLGHFKYLPSTIGCSLEENQGLSIINCGLESSMFNIVFGGLVLADQGGQWRIQDIINHFKAQPFAWWVPPSKCSPSLIQHLNQAGLRTETVEHAMICNLNSFEAKPPRTGLQISQVLNEVQLHDFISVLEPYDVTARRFYEQLDTSQLNEEEKLFVGYNNKTPVVISILFNGKQAAGIFSLLTQEGERGKGFGSDMMRHLMNFAKRRGQQYAILSASSDSGYQIYEHLGFKRLGYFECFERKGKDV